MAEISNKTLALLLIIAIVISLGGTFVSLNRLYNLKKIFVPEITGLATDTGTLSLTISENVAINFSVNDTMNWGTGAVDTGKTTCLLQSNYTNGSALTYSGDAITNNCTQDDFQTVGNFVVENIGNRNVTLNITGSAARTLFGVSGGNYSFNITNKPGETPCKNASGTSHWDRETAGDDGSRIPWTPFKGTAAANAIGLCQNKTDVYGFGFDDANDEFYINIQMKLPYDAYGALSDTITLSATSYTK